MFLPPACEVRREVMFLQVSVTGPSKVLPQVQPGEGLFCSPVTGPVQSPVPGPTLSSPCHDRGYLHPSQDTGYSPDPTPSRSLHPMINHISYQTAALGLLFWPFLWNSEPSPQNCEPLKMWTFAAMTQTKQRLRHPCLYTSGTAGFFVIHLVKIRVFFLWISWFSSAQ